MTDVRTLPRHTFLSYSNKEKQYARRIAEILQRAGIPVWFDYLLQPGDENYDERIRTAIQQAFAFVLLASPSSAGSKYVLGEIRTAQRNKLPIVPLWIAGEFWEDSVYTELITTQYLDLRDESNFNDGINRLKSKLAAQISSLYPQHIEDSSPQPVYLFDNHVIQIYLCVKHEKRKIAFNRHAFHTRLEMLNAIYNLFLASRLAPAYGTTWLLSENLTFSYRLFVPWSWFLPGKRTLPVAVSEPDWLQDGIVWDLFTSYDSWEIFDPLSLFDIPLVAIVADKKEIVEHIIHNLHDTRAGYGFLSYARSVAAGDGNAYVSGLLGSAFSLADLKIVSADSVDIHKYPFYAVMAIHSEWQKNVARNLHEKVILVSSSVEV
jgi:hypothetical protein